MTREWRTITASKGDYVAHLVEVPLSLTSRAECGAKVSPRAQKNDVYLLCFKCRLIEKGKA